jgi:hypothetical protein
LARRSGDGRVSPLSQLSNRLRSRVRGESGCAAKIPGFLRLRNRATQGCAVVRARRRSKFGRGVFELLGEF